MVTTTTPTAVTAAQALSAVETANLRYKKLFLDLVTSMKACDAKAQVLINELPDYHSLKALVRNVQSTLKNGAVPQIETMYNPPVTTTTL